VTMKRTRDSPPPDPKIVGPPGIALIMRKFRARDLLLLFLPAEQAQTGGFRFLLDHFSFVPDSGQTLDKRFRSDHVPL